MATDFAKGICQGTLAIYLMGVASGGVIGRGVVEWKVIISKVNEQDYSEGKKIG